MGERVFIVVYNQSSLAYYIVLAYFRSWLRSLEMPCYAIILGLSAQLSEYGTENLSKLVISLAKAAVVDFIADLPMSELANLLDALLTVCAMRV
jgi:hypothetical protein